MGNSRYAWIIVKDHLSDGPNDPLGNDKGVVGPRGAAISDDATTFSLKSAELARNYEHRHQFRMYDDDGELYYTGTLYWDGEASSPDVGDDDLEVCYAPLAEFGMGAAGCTHIRYSGKPGWDCG